MFLGITGALVANTILFVGIYSYQKEISDFIAMNNLNTIGATFSLVLITGIIISLVSTYFAVNKFLKLKFDELFY